MKIESYYRTLDGNIGKLVSITKLNHFFHGVFSLDEEVILCQLEFDGGHLEYWLASQLIELDHKGQTSLF